MDVMGICKLLNLFATVTPNALQQVYICHFITAIYNTDCGLRTNIAIVYISVMLSQLA